MRWRILILPRLRRAASPGAQDTGIALALAIEGAIAGHGNHGKKGLTNAGNLV